MNKSTTVKYTARCTTAWDGDTFGELSRLAEARGLS